MSVRFTGGVIAVGIRALFTRALFVMAYALFGTHLTEVRINHHSDQSVGAQVGPNQLSIKRHEDRLFIRFTDSLMAELVREPLHAVSRKFLRSGGQLGAAEVLRALITGTPVSGISVSVDGMLA